MKQKPIKDLLSRSLLVIALTLVAVFSIQAEEGAAKSMAAPAEEAAAVAGRWLALLDTQAYNESWSEASELFRGHIGQRSWKELMWHNRRPLGETVSRNMINAHHTSTIPDGPPGEYLIMEFETEFSNGSSAIETITPMRDVDGTWRVGGYYFRMILN